MNKKFHQLTGDADVYDVFFKKGILSLTYTEWETDKTYRIKIKTSRFISDEQSAKFSAHVRLEKLADIVPVEQESEISID